MNSLDMTLFGDRNYILRSFILQPSLTDYKETGKRTFTTTTNVEDRVRDALDVADISSKIGLRSIVDRDISLVKLENQCESHVEIDGGISAPRYIFTMIVDIIALSGNITRLTLKGYTSAFELNQHHDGRFTSAIPTDALFYIDSYSSMIYAKNVHNRYIATNSVANEHILSTDMDVTKTMLRPADIALANHIGNVGGVHALNTTNILNGRKNELSAVSDVSTAMFTKKILDGVMSSYHDTYSDLGFGGSLSDGVDSQGSYFNMAATTLTQVPLFIKLLDALKRNKISVFTIQELENMLGVRSLDGFIQVIPHTGHDLSISQTGILDVNNLGSDTITVGTHDFFNNLQSTITHTGFVDLHFDVIVNYMSYGDDKFELVITNFQSVFDNGDGEALRTRVGALRNMLISQCLEPLDRFLRFDEMVNRVGHYVVSVQYRGYVDCVIRLQIGNEEMIFRYPIFAASRLSPLVTDEAIGNKFGGMVGTFAGIGNSMIEKNATGPLVTETHRIPASHANQPYVIENPMYKDHQDPHVGMVEEAVY